MMTLCSLRASSFVQFAGLFFGHVYLRSHFVKVFPFAWRSCSSIHLGAALLEQTIILY